ncbi:hypothetical protein M2103_001633 [Ereboglobus sp. PH5-5]|uniref:hypothetical protein n=1 Tax=Ereboglobus sp. PH5-5 TaxID=2940529 RepID=UPI002405E8E0|nr:hypothetical protein [Ereboglobus sp. PH5-5]MDF9833409.1 hypothetical protein [Ereboglobus sp. PH5-5]
MKRRLQSKLSVCLLLLACVLASHTDVRAAVVRIYDSRDRNIERVSTNHGTGTDYYYDTDNRLAAAEKQPKGSESNRKGQVDVC